MKVISMTSMCVDRYDTNDSVYPGGEALIFSVNCSKYNHMDVHLIGSIGNDNYGKAILDVLKDKKINTDCVHVEDGITANNLIYLTKEGDRYFKEDSWFDGVYATFSLYEQDKISMKSADMIHTYVNCPVLEDILQLKNESGFKLAIDFNNFREFEKWEAFIDKVDIFFISATDDILPILENWSKKYKGIFIGTLAERGSVAFEDGIKYEVSAEKVTEVVDTTGCGDSYQAGFIAGYCLNKDIIYAMNEGSKAAAKTLSHIGGICF